MQEDFGTRSTVTANIPAAQTEQVFPPADLYCPDGQEFMHVAAPTPEYFPTSQAAQLDEPSVGVKVFALQREHSLALAAE